MFWAITLTRLIISEWMDKSFKKSRNEMLVSWGSNSNNSDNNNTMATMAKRRTGPPHDTEPILEERRVRPKLSASLQDGSGNEASRQSSASAQDSERPASTTANQNKEVPAVEIPVKKFMPTTARVRRTRSSSRIRRHESPLAR